MKSFAIFPIGYFMVSIFAGVSAVFVDVQPLFYISFTYLGMGIIEAHHYIGELLNNGR